MNVTTMHEQHGNRSFRIAEQFRQAISDGTLAAGTRLAGQRELAAQYDTTLITIRRPLAVLEYERPLVSLLHGRRFDGYVDMI